MRRTTQAFRTQTSVNVALSDLEGLDSEGQRNADLAYFTRWYLENPDEARRVRQEMTTAELRLFASVLASTYVEINAAMLARVMPPDCLF